MELALVVGHAQLRADLREEIGPPLRIVRECHVLQAQGQLRPHLRGGHRDGLDEVPAQDRLVGLGEWLEGGLMFAMRWRLRRVPPPLHDVLHVHHCRMPQHGVDRQARIDGELHELHNVARRGLAARSAPRPRRASPYPG